MMCSRCGTHLWTSVDERGGHRAAAASSVRPPAPKISSETPALDPNEPFTAEFLRNVKDPAGFVRSRLEALNVLSPAAVRSALGGLAMPLNPACLSTREQAEAMLARLQQLGLPVQEISEPTFAPGPFTIDYGGDPRRPFEIAGMNVGALLRWYAAHPKEVAEQMILDEWRSISSAFDNSTTDRTLSMSVRAQSSEAGTGSQAAEPQGEACAFFAGAPGAGGGLAGTVRHVREELSPRKPEPERGIRVLPRLKEGTMTDRTAERQAWRSDAFFIGPSENEQALSSKLTQTTRAASTIFLLKDEVAARVILDEWRRLNSA